MSAALAGKRVLLTRSVEDNRAWAELLRRRGVQPLVLACIRTAPRPEAAGELLRELADCDWLALSSRRAVAAVAAIPASVRIACVGPATAAAALEAFGRVDRVAALGTGRSLGAELAATLPRSSRVVVAAAEDGRTDIEEVLRPAGIDVRRVDVYRTLPVERSAEGERKSPPLPIDDLALDALFLASPTAVRGLVNQVLVPKSADAVALGPTTAAAAREAGIAVRAEAQARGLDGLCAAYAALLERRAANEEETRP
jgi:uroporphyrinogen-III synthase